MQVESYLMHFKQMEWRIEMEEDQRVVKIPKSIADPSFLIGNNKLYCKKRDNRTKRPPAHGIKVLYHSKNQLQTKTKITSRYQLEDQPYQHLALCGQVC